MTVVDIDDARGDGADRNRWTRQRSTRGAPAVGDAPPHHADRGGSGARRTMAAAGVEFIAVSFVRKGSDVDEVRDVVGATGPARGQDRDDAAIDEPRRDRRRVRCRDGRPGRPRHRLPARGRAAPAEDDRAAVRRVRRSRDHRDPDARVDDHRRLHRRGPRSAMWPTPCSTARTR